MYSPAAYWGRRRRQLEADYPLFNYPPRFCSHPSLTISALVPSDAGEAMVEGEIEKEGREKEHHSAPASMSELSSWPIFDRSAIREPNFLTSSKLRMLQLNPLSTEYFTEGPHSCRPDSWRYDMEAGLSASECPVCFEKLGENRKPYSLSCGHTLCRICVFSLLSRGSTELSCPLCRTVVKKTSIKV